MAETQGNVTSRKASSIEEFCDDHSISRSTFYNLRREGKGPRLMRIGARVLISSEAAADWRRDREHVEA